MPPPWRVTVWAAREANAGPSKQAGGESARRMGESRLFKRGRGQQRQSRGPRIKRYAGTSGARGCEERVARADG